MLQCFVAKLLIISVVGLAEHVSVQMQVYDANATPVLSSSEMLEVLMINQRDLMIDSTMKNWWGPQN